MTVQTRPVSRGNKIFVTAMFLLMAVGFVSIPIYFSFREFVYSRFGKVANATVTHRAGGWQSGGRGSPGRPVLNVEYSFKDDAGHSQTGRDVLPSGWDAQQGQPIKIEYVSGTEGMSRVAGNSRDVRTIWLVCVIPGAMFFAMAWIVWAVTTTGNAPPKPNPVKQELPPVVWSEKDRRNWRIACGVGAVIIAVSLFIDRGVVGVLVTLIVLYALAMLYAVDLQRRTVRHRIHGLWSLAQELTWEFAADGNEKLHQGLSRFHLAKLCQSSVLTNLIYGRCDGTDVAVFDFTAIRGKNQATQTVVWMQRRGVRMTEFALRPESAWNKLGVWIGHGDINFESHPEFSRSYLLRGDDENAIRELFTDAVLNFYERHPDLITEGSGTKLLFYRDRVLVKPENLRSFLDEALAVRALFLPASDV